MKFLFRTLLALILSIALFASCKKENTPTQGQLMVARLKSETWSGDIKSVMIMSYSNGTTRDAGVNLTYNGDGTVTVWDGNSGTAIYSLDNLISYEYNNGTLFLYF